MGGNEASSSNNNFEDGHHSEEPNHLHNEYNYHQDHEQMVDHDRVQDMISDAFLETTTTIADGTGNVEEPNLDAKRFYEMLDAANQPIYTGCREGLSKLSLAARMMNIKTDHNLPENCMDAWMHGRSCLKSICQKTTCLLNLIMRFRNWFIVLDCLRR